MALANKPTTADLFGTAAAAADYVVGTLGDDVITGGASATIAVTADGNDFMEGGAGDDVYIVNETADIILELANEGTDTVYASVSGYTLPSEVENGALVALGTPAAGTLTGNTKDNKLDGLQNTGVVSTLIGLAGNDTYYVDSNDIVTEIAGGGTDTIISATSININGVSSTTGLYIENAYLSGLTASQTIIGNPLANKLTGNTVANIITGNAGNDTIDGGNDAAADNLTGGVGDDTYIIRHTATPDVITEVTGQGTDTVKATITGYTLAANVESLILMGNVVAGDGNSGNNLLTGNAAGNTLSDSAVGAAGNDTLNGGAGADAMNAGVGNDTYLIDNTGDRVTDSAGTDTIQSSVTFTTTISASAIENIILTGTTAISAVIGAASTVNTTITGNSAINTLTSGAGNDKLLGVAGNDVLNGDVGNDTLDGGTGSDAMTGGAGDDTYVVDSSTDSITDSAGAADTLQTSVTLSSIPSGIENITLIGTGAIDAIGTSAANVITGNAANNNLNGSATNGTDTYYGMGGNDSIAGGSANDTITGGTGLDTLTGGTGNDTFILEAVAVANAENITDFAVAGDILAFDISSMGLAPADYLSGAVSIITATEATALTATTAANNIIVDTLTNIQAMIDADSAWSGGAIAIAYAATVGTDAGSIYWDGNADFSAGLQLVGTIPAGTLTATNLTIIA